MLPGKNKTSGNGILPETEEMKFEKTLNGKYKERAYNWIANGDKETKDKPTNPGICVDYESASPTTKKRKIKKLLSKKCSPSGIIKLSWKKAAMMKRWRSSGPV